MGTEVLASASAGYQTPLGLPVMQTNKG